ncbi:MAG: hypothetical protein IPL61_12095 [Myxococcales bacterium]|nr:hypothetical protein [Myxococcales bacterium]
MPATGLTDAPFQTLAEQFRMTGGWASRTRSSGPRWSRRARTGTLTVDDLWTGADAEYAEMGKVLSTHTRM